MQQPAKFFYKRLNSTNLYISNMLAIQPLKDPFWVRTDNQYAGKGQGSHSWSSEPGMNLTGSLAIFPDRFEAFRQFDLSKSFALAAVSFLELFIDEIQIKWPNDLYAGNKKIGGILIETSLMGSYINSAIMGIGLNINQVIFSEKIPNPVSISLLTGMQYNLTELEDLFLESFLNQYRFIESGSFDRINDQYISKLYKFNEPAEFKAGGESFKAKITGVTEFGHLILQTESGSVQTYGYQEVEYIIPA